MGAELIFAGYLNKDLRRTGGVALATVGLQDISANYLPQRRACNWYQTPCVVVKQGRLMRSLTAYILCSDRLIILNISVWSCCVCVFASLSDQSYYLCLWIHLPLCLLWRHTGTQLNNIFTEFRRDVPNHNKLAGITTPGFLSQCGELCMIISMSPLQYNPTFSLYSPKSY